MGFAKVHGDIDCTCKLWCALARAATNAKIETFDNGRTHCQSKLQQCLHSCTYNM